MHQLDQAATRPQDGHWRSQPAPAEGSAAGTGFLTDLRPAAGCAPDPKTRTARLTTELTARLDRISRDSAEALYAVLVAATAALLGRHTGQDEVVCHPAPLGAGPHGPYAPLPLRAELAGSTLRELLAQVGRALRTGEPHQDPAAPVGAPEVAVELDALHGPARPSSAGMRFAFAVGDAREGLSFTLTYDASRWTEETARRLCAHLVLLLDRATAEPDRSLDAIDLCTDEDRRVVARANDTAHAYGADGAATLHGLFAARAARQPEAPAVLTADGTLSYGELDARSNQLAHTLRGRGAGPGTLVALLAERSPELMVALMAVLKTGAAYLPVDPSYPQARIDHLLSDSGASLALAQAAFTALPADGTPVLDLDDPETYAARTGPVEPRGGADDLAYVIYTSGSTGRPKGVEIEHRSAVNRLLWMQRAYPLGPGDVVLQKTSVSFDVSVWELFWWSFTGASCALPEPGGEKDPEALLAAVERYGVTTMHFVPSMLTMLLAHLDRFPDGARRAGTLRQVFASGEPLAPGQAARFGGLLPHAALVNLYGPTEAAVDVTHQPCTGLEERARLPIGRPIDNVRLHVLDPAGRPAPVGVLGELHIAGLCLARGYLGRAELTAERFVPGPGAGEERLYRTGDLARWLPDGTLEYLGRTDQQVKVRGFRVEPGEIEERLRAHPEVRDAAVVAVDDGWQTSLRAFVVPGAGQTVDQAVLKQFVREALPEYMVPGRVLAREALPLTPNGKLDRAALRAPEALRPQAPAFAEPRTEGEKTLAGIWREVLERRKVGLHDNFFALGGNSIHFVTVLAKARAAGLDFTFQQLFKYQTVAQLSAVIEAAADGGAPGAGTAHGTPGAAGAEADVAARGAFRPFELIADEDRTLLPEDAEDAYPLSLLQAGLIFQTEITGGLGQYHDVLSYAVSDRFDTGAFTEAVRQLTARHPMLRTTYHLTGFSEFLQVVHREVEPPLTVADLRGLDPAEQERRHEKWLAAEKARAFAWEQPGELVTLHVQILADDRYRYTVSQHNSALDGWSISLLHTQLFDLYHRIRDGRDTSREPVDNHLRNFVGLELEALRSPRSRDFWRGVLEDCPAPADVPPRAGAEPSAGFEVVLRDVPLPAGLTARIEATAEALRVPAKDVLLAAHVKVLGLLSGQRTVLTGYEHSGRPELPGAETTLGLHLNTVPFQVDLAGGTWGELVRRVYAAEHDLLPHRRYPMARMKQDLGTQRTLFGTTFNYTHFYLMKHLSALPEFSLMDMRVDSETEFPFRTEFSRHFADDEFRLCLHYHTHLYDEAGIDRIGGYFVRVLELMTGRTHEAHDAVPVLAEEDARAAAEAAGTASGRNTASPRLQGRRQPAAAAAAAGAAGSAARRSTLARITEVCSEVLGLPAGQLGPDDDFFALGGNSLSALRVVLELDGLVTLSDLVATPSPAGLASIADAADARAAEGTAEGSGEDTAEQLLQRLSPQGEAPRAALICVPYPCGHPVNFQPLARELAGQAPDLVVYGLEPPGHGTGSSADFTAVAETARRTVDEVERKADLPLILWGHCGGAAVTVELARLLEDRGFDLRHVFLGSKLLPPADDMRESIAMIESWSDEQIVRYMVEETGYTELESVKGPDLAFLGALFRHDVCDGYRYFIERTEEGGPPSGPRPRRIEAPVTAVVAADDKGLTHAVDHYPAWELVAEDVTFAELDDGGHYFIRGNPAATAELIARAWESADGTEG